VSVIPPPPTTDSTESSNSDDNTTMYIIIGACVGGVLLLVTVIGICCCCCKKQRPDLEEQGRVPAGVNAYITTASSHKLKSAASSPAKMISHPSSRHGSRSMHSSRPGRY
jgi:hypothetical protein